MDVGQSVEGAFRFRAVLAAQPMPSTVESGNPLFLTAEQDDQRAFPAVGWLGLAIGQHFLALRQPAAHQLTQDRHFLRRAQALAMDHPDTTRAAMQRFGQEGGELLPGLVAVEAVQVDFFPGHPASAPEIAEDALGQARAQVMRFIAAFRRCRC